MKIRTLVLICFAVASLRASDPTAMLQDTQVKAAFAAIEHYEPEMISEQIRVCEIASPPFHEVVRAAELKRLFDGSKLQNVHIDKAGNVIGTRPGASPHPNVVIAALLDTVFPEGAFQVPSHPKTTFNVGRVGGGTPVNAIPYQAWMEVDRRSADVKSLEALHTKFKAAMNEAVSEENARWGGKGPVKGSPELVGLRPAGYTPESSAIVQTAEAVSSCLSLPVHLGERSTDSNVPLNLGIPAITIGAGGKGSGAHSLDETYATTDSWKGVERALLLVLSLAQ